jgi:hypothetical protein
MSNRIYIPIINPLKFVDDARANVAQYFTKQFDDFLFSEQIYDFQQPADGRQIFSLNDIISLQYSANFSPLQISFVSACDDAVWLTFTASSNIRNTYEPDYYLYEDNFDISALPVGSYYIKFEAGSPVQKTLRSETFRITSNIRNTLLFEYQNSSYYEDVIFETGIKFGLRVPGFLRYDEPGSQDVVYQDQNLNNTILSSNHYRNYKLFIGSPAGIPFWQIDRLDRIIGCDNFTIDGKPFSKPDGGKWEKAEEVDYPLQGWTIQLRESINRKSIIFDSEGNTSKKVIIVHNIDSKGFGDVFAPGQNVVPIIELE